MGSARRGSNPLGVVSAGTQQPHMPWAHTLLLSPSGGSSPRAVAMLRRTQYPCGPEMDKGASAGNRARVTSMATMYSTTRPLMLLTSFKTAASRRTASSYDSSFSPARRPGPGSLALSQGMVVCAGYTAVDCGESVANTTPRGFEPLRPEANGFRVHLLSHSDTVSCMQAASAQSF